MNPTIRAPRFRHGSEDLPSDRRRARAGSERTVDPGPAPSLAAQRMQRPGGAADGGFCRTQPPTWNCMASVTPTAWDAGQPTKKGIARSCWNSPMATALANPTATQPAAPTQPRPGVPPDPDAGSQTARRSLPPGSPRPPWLHLAPPPNPASFPLNTVEKRGSWGLPLATALANPTATQPQRDRSFMSSGVRQSVLERGSR
jgi:hypothetical protein